VAPRGEVALPKIREFGHATFLKNGSGLLQKRQHFYQHRCSPKKKETTWRTRPNCLIQAEPLIA
jgi:hypothetical protein